jgi:hypothetical protein
MRSLNLTGRDCYGSAGAGANVGLLGSALASKERLGLHDLPDAGNLRSRRDRA